MNTHRHKNFWKGVADYFYFRAPLKGKLSIFRKVAVVTTIFPIRSKWMQISQRKGGFFQKSSFCFITNNHITKERLSEVILVEGRV